MSIYLRPVHKRVPGASCGKSGPISVGLVSRERSTGDARCTISLLVLVFSLPSSNTLENNTVVVTISSLAAIFPILLPAMTPGEMPYNAPESSYGSLDLPFLASRSSEEQRSIRVAEPPRSKSVVVLPTKYL